MEESRDSPDLDSRLLPYRENKLRVVSKARTVKTGLLGKHFAEFFLIEKIKEPPKQVAVPKSGDKEGLFAGIHDYEHWVYGDSEDEIEYDKRGKGASYLKERASDKKNGQDVDISQSKIKDSTPIKINEVPVIRFAAFRFNPNAVFYESHNVWSTDQLLIRNLPPPYPPKTNKACTCSNLAFRKIDEKAMKVPKKLLGRQLHLLVRHLTDDLTNDLDRLRSLYSWLTSVSVDKTKFPLRTPAKGTVYDFLMGLNKRRMNHAQMFSYMCSIVNIQCVIINGFQKGSRFDIDKALCRDENYGEWNAVLINDDWRLVNAFWGSHHNQSITNRKDLSVNENFFIPDPEILLYTHFPAEEKWQLVENPISLIDFESKVYLKERFFELNLRILSHYQMQLLVENGEIELNFNLDANDAKYLSFKCILKRQSGDTFKEVSKSGKNPFDMIYILEDVLTVKIRFPKRGVYRVEIIGKDSRQKERGYDYDFCVIYAASVTKRPPKFQTFPICGEAGWGNNVQCEELGIFPEFYNPCVITDESEISISYSLKPSTKIKGPFMYRVVDSGTILTDAESVEVEIKNFRYTVQLSLQPDQEIAVCIYMNIKGNTKDPKFVNIGNFLIYYQRPPTPKAPPTPPMLSLIDLAKMPRTSKYRKRFSQLLRPLRSLKPYGSKSPRTMKKVPVKPPHDKINRRMRRVYLHQQSGAATKTVQPAVPSSSGSSGSRSHRELQNLLHPLRKLRLEIRENTLQKKN